MEIFVPSRICLSVSPFCGAAVPLLVLLARGTKAHAFKQPRAYFRRRKLGKEEAQGKKEEVDRYLSRPVNSAIRGFFSEKISRRRQVRPVFTFLTVRHVILRHVPWKHLSRLDRREREREGSYHPPLLALSKLRMPVYFAIRYRYRCIRLITYADDILYLPRLYDRQTGLRGNWLSQMEARGIFYVLY